MEKKEESKLQTISLDELEKIGMTTADVFGVLQNSKREVIFLRAGEYVLPSFIDKFRAKGIKSFYLKPHMDSQELDLWKAAWEQIKKMQNLSEFEIFEARKEFVSQFKSLYFDGKIATSLLSLMSVTHKEFAGLNSDFMFQYAEKNYILFKRSILVASLSLPLIISYGYVEWQFLKDVYNSILLLSYHLSDEKFTVTMKNALTLESMGKGLALEYLKIKSPGEVINLMNKEELEQICTTFYEAKNEHVKDLYTIFYETYKKKEDDGILIESETPDWISVILFVEKIIPYEDYQFFPGDGKMYLKNRIEKTLTGDFIKSFSFKKIRNLLKDFWKVENIKEAS